MRPNTRLSGILSTKRNSPVSTSMLTRMLVPKPKNAFQSPGVQSTGLKSDRAELAVPYAFIALLPRLLSVQRLRSHCFQNSGRVSDPAEDATLGLDHPQAHVVEFREVGGAAVRDDDAEIDAVIGL